MQLTGGTFTQALVKQIKAATAFSGQKVHTERQTQGLTRPCFFVEQVSLSQVKLMVNRYRRTYRMTISWLPKLESNTQEADCRNVGEELLGLFRIIQLAEPCRPRDMSYEVVDGSATKELRFSLEAVVHALWPLEEIPDMQTLDIDERVKQREQERSD